MRNYIILFFLGTLFLTACGGSDSVPRDVIPQDRMIDLLTDIHLANGSTYTLNQSRDSLYKYAMHRYLVVFKKYQTDTLQFKKSMEFYTEHPKQLDDMYTVILDKLKAKTDSLNKTKEKLTK
ncbi:DUF4296 domain-containing protein [Mucilaginibacter sp. KACC 22063]|uniref:DUF4296 domain-containing protein n=1 Tax=Mucilaginibacter sp. KACC 22063 TaxID=3025666 RepID=UPI0023666ABC|nr:DUF4296 domain-containing protein [Mucilaginibacter sp. KACC 22063]WDF53657.1 DUF4296 domain-containing protein [Mucilaginibacter sp. KACC 22063]